MKCIQEKYNYYLPTLYPVIIFKHIKGHSIFSGSSDSLANPKLVVRRDLTDWPSFFSGNPG